MFGGLQVLNIRYQRWFFYLTIFMMSVVAVNVWSVGDNQPAQAHDGESDQAKKSEEVVANHHCSNQPIPENAYRTKCVVTWKRGKHWNVWHKQICVGAGIVTHCTTHVKEEDCYDTLHYRSDPDGFRRGCPHENGGYIDAGYTYIDHYSTHGTHESYQHYDCNEGYRFVAFGNPPCVMDTTTTSDDPDPDDTTTDDPDTRDSGTSDDTSDSGDPPPSKDPVTPTPNDPPPPDCDANEELVNGVCVPVCVWGHDHGLGCHPYTRPPCPVASGSGTGRHWHGWHHSSCHNQEPPCPTGQHRHGDGRKSTYRPGSHPHWSDECHAVLPDCNTVQHRHGNGREATYLGLYTHRAGSESHWSNDCHTREKRYCDAGKHRHNTREGEAANYQPLKHAHYPDECHPSPPGECPDGQHRHANGSDYHANTHPHWEDTCHIDWECDPRPTAASHDPTWDKWLANNPGAVPPSQMVAATRCPLRLEMPCLTTSTTPLLT